MSLRDWLHFVWLRRKDSEKGEGLGLGAFELRDSLVFSFLFLS
jgi:hypothetical protein